MFQAHRPAHKGEVFELALCSKDPIKQIAVFCFKETGAASVIQGDWQTYRCQFRNVVGRTGCDILNSSEFAQAGFCGDFPDRSCARKNMVFGSWVNLAVACGI